MSIARVIISVWVATMVATSTLAQIRIISPEKRDSVVNPSTIKSEDMHFEAGRSIDFGSIKEDSGRVTQRVIWHNVGAKPITITRITTSCGCVRCDYPHGVIEKNRESEITIYYYPKGHPGTMRHRIFIYTDRSQQTPTAILDIKGNVQASADRRGDYPNAIGSLLLRSREIQIESGADKMQTIRIACMNGGKSTLTPKADTLLSSENITLSSEPQTLRAGEEGDIIIRYTPSKGTNRQPLRLFVENPNLPPRDRELKITIKTE